MIITGGMGRVGDCPEDDCEGVVYRLREAPQHYKCSTCYRSGWLTNLIEDFDDKYDDEEGNNE